MEPYTHYLMWMKSRHKSHNNIVMSSNNKNNNNSLSSSSSSWEEEGFADGKAAGGVLGGFVWPPRSYLCSFCKREFRSAQALGGHMNVHRRDRAKLKQSLIITPPPPPPTTQVLHQHHQNHTPPTPSSRCGSKNEDPMMLNEEFDCFGKNDEDIVRCKRHKKRVVSLLPPLLKKPCLINDNKSAGNKVSPIMEEIDLELRLGVV